MKSKKVYTVLVLTAGLCAMPFARAQTAFTYQGKLVDDCCPATGNYDMIFKVYDSSAAGSPPNAQVGLTFTTNNVGVTNGLFTVYLNFDSPGSTVSAVFTGPRRWLEIQVRTNNATPPATFVTLCPRTELTPTPYALYAQKAGMVIDDSITGANILNGQVVKSLNGLRDNINLVAGPNVTLTPSGNNLQISATDGIWSLNGANAYYNAGNVGIGTATPQAALDVNGGLAIYGAQADPRISVGGTPALATILNTAIPNENQQCNGLSVKANTAIVAASQSGNSAILGAAEYGVQGAHAPGHAYGRLGYGGHVGGELPHDFSYGVYGKNSPGDFDYAGYFDGNLYVDGTAEIYGSLKVSQEQAIATLSSETDNGSVLELANNRFANGNQIYLGAINFNYFGATPGQIGYLTTGVTGDDQLQFRVGDSQRLIIGGAGYWAAEFFDNVRVHGGVNATSFTQSSDRDLKENFERVSPREVLEKVSSLPIQRWNFKGETTEPHVGPMAQDFYAAFGLGTDDKHIATVDADGVALAAIQGLHELVKERDGEIQDLRQSLAELRATVALMKAKAGLANPEAR